MDDTLAAAINLKDAARGEPAPDQVQIIRSQALLIPDVVTNPMLPPLGSTWPDEVKETPLGEEFVDIDAFGVGIDQNQNTTHVFASTFGLFPENISDLSYTFAIDLDNNAATGGALADIGVPSTIEGVELIGQVEVEVNDGVASGTPTVLRFQSGAFVEITDPSIKARIGTLETAAISASQPAPQQETFPTGQIVQLILSNALRGPTAADLNAAVVSENANTGTADTVEGEIFLTPPTFPVCQVIPGGAVIGSSVTVTASDLQPDSDVEIFLAEEQVGVGTTDSSGNASLELLIPVDAPAGAQLVVVHALGSAVTASCAINLLAAPVFDVPPSPSSGSIFAVEVGQTVTFPIRASDANTNENITLGVIGLPEGAIFPIPAPSNPAATAFSWTPTVEQVGSRVVVFTAVDSIGLSATPHSIGLVVPARIVDIDIKPGSEPNSINCNNDKQLVTVAILSAEDFDATEVDHTTVIFEGASETHVDRKSGERHRHEGDVDGDGDIDLVFHFRLGDTGLTCDSTGGRLSGQTFDGPAITGTDAILMIDTGGGRP